MGASGFHVCEDVEHRRFFVEVRRDPPARVVVAQRIQTDVDVTAEMRAHYLRGQRQIGGIGTVHTFAPIAFDRRHPT